MLDLSQLKQGKFRKVATCFDIRQAVSEILTVQEYKAEQMGISIKVKFDNFPAEGAAAPDYSICTDEQRLQQILLNYLSNGLKFTERGGRVKLAFQLISPDSEDAHRDRWKPNLEEFWNQRLRLSDIEIASVSSSDSHRLGTDELTKYLEEQEEAISAIF